MKKISASILAFTISWSYVCHAESNYEINIDNKADIPVITEEVKYLPGKSVSAGFKITNSNDFAIELDICVDIKNESGKRVGKATLSRGLKAGESVPVNYGASGIVETGNIDINLLIKEKGLENVIYVSADGNDNNPGTEKKPLKSISEAVKKVEGLNQNNAYSGEDISIIIEDGKYSVPEMVSISESSVSNLSSLSIEGENAVLHGGVSVTGAEFEKVTNETELSMFQESVSDKLYKINLSDFGITTKYDNGTDAANEPIYTLLYYNGKTEQIAKYPNDGYATGTTNIYLQKEGSVTSSEVRDWKNFDEAWVRGWFIWEWDMVKGRLENITEQDKNGERTLILEQLFCGSYPDNKELPKSYSNKKWYIYNLPEELDIEGEYAIKDGILYYYPLEENVKNGDFEKAEILINTDTNNMFNITADNVTVKGLTFENSAGYFINALADDFKLIDCEFRNCAKNAVLVKGCNNLVSACDFYNIGAQGLSLEGGDRATLTKSNNVVENCYFEKTGQVSRTGGAAITLRGCGATARRNTITGTPHLAMSYVGNDHLIEYNEITGCLTDNAGDAGLIYTGNNISNQGTIIRNNYLHDSNSGLGGVYWDDWLSGQRAEGNVFENLNRVLLIHGGVCNVFKDNIIINASYGAQVRGKGRMVDKIVRYKNEVGEQIETYTKFNIWDVAPIMIENKDTPNGYSPYGNVFLSQMVGNYYVTNETYPKLPWQGETWQKAYGNVLKYVNNKVDDLANETELSGNYFVNSQNEIYCYAQMQGKEDTLIVTSPNVLGATELTAEKEAHYRDVVENSGIYENEYRTVK